MEERITVIKDCNCERGCQHKIVTVSQDYIVHRDELNEFISEFKDERTVFELRRQVGGRK